MNSLALITDLPILQQNWCNATVFGFNAGYFGQWRQKN